MLRLTLVLVLIACVGQIIGVPLNQAHQNELKAFKAMLEKSEKAKKTEGTNESRVGPGGEPPKFMSVEGWKDCMESKDMGSWDAWCLPAQKPKSNKCLEKSWKELQEMEGAKPCGGPGNDSGNGSETKSYRQGGGNNLDAAFRQGTTTPPATTTTNPPNTTTQGTTTATTQGGTSTPPNAFRQDVGAGNDDAGSGDEGDEGDGSGQQAGEANKGNDSGNGSETKSYRHGAWYRQGGGNNSDADVGAGNAGDEPAEDPEQPEGSGQQEGDAVSCDKAPCKNNGTCFDNTEGFLCKCSSGWSGQTCEESDKKPEAKKEAFRTGYGTPKKGPWTAFRQGGDDSGTMNNLMKSIMDQLAKGESIKMVVDVKPQDVENMLSLAGGGIETTPLPGEFTEPPFTTQPPPLSPEQNKNPGPGYYRSGRKG